MSTQDQRLTEVLEAHGVSKCPDCGREIDRGDVAWNNACTEAGTDYSTVEIICQGCETSIAHVCSWYPEIETMEDVLHVLEDDWDIDPLWR